MRPAVKYQAILKNKYAYSISFLCKFFEVSRSGYYKWLKQKDKLDKDLALGKLIQECQQKTKQTYGYRRVKLWLSKYKGLHINQKRVLRVMRRYGLLSEIRRPGPYQKGITRFKTYENLLKQEFAAQKPNEKWVSDISYIHTQQGTLYLAVIKDLFDHSIVAYETGTRQDNGMITRLIERQSTRSGKEPLYTAIREDNILPKNTFFYQNAMLLSLPCRERLHRWITPVQKAFLAH